MFSHGIRIINAGRRRRCWIAVAVAEEDLIGKAKGLAVRACAAKHGLVIIVAHGVFVSEGFEEWRVAVLHVEELHGLPGVVRSSARRRGVGGVNRRLEIMETTGGVALGDVLRVDGAIDLLDHLKVLMDGIAGISIEGQVRAGQLEGTRR